MSDQRVQPSRRQFFQWMKQVTAGVSVAAIGVAAASTPTLAASNKLGYTNTAHPNPSTVQPDCVQCPPYGSSAGSSCDTVKNCYPSHKQYTAYIYLGGCAVGGVCPTDVGSSHCGC